MNEEQTIHHGSPPAALLEMLSRLAGIHELGEDLPDPSTPLGQETRVLFESNWENAKPLLSRLTRMRIRPAQLGPAPHVFRFEVDLRYKRKRGAAPPELVDGTLRGTIRYRTDLLLADPDEPTVSVSVDPTQGYFHPNYHRGFGVLCLGHLPPGAFSLDALIEHLYWVLTYQNRSVTDPADREAARYFALDPDAMAGLEDVPPLYEVEAER